MTSKIFQTQFGGKLFTLETGHPEADYTIGVYDSTVSDGKIALTPGGSVEFYSVESAGGIKIASSFLDSDDYGRDYDQLLSLEGVKEDTGYMPPQ